MTVRDLIKEQNDNQRITVYQHKEHSISTLITEGCAEEILALDSANELYDYEVSALDSEVKFSTTDSNDLYIYF